MKMHEHRTDLGSVEVKTKKKKKKAEGLLGLEPPSHEYEPDSSRSILFA